MNFFEAPVTNSFLENTFLRMAMHGGHQSEPVNSTSTDLFSALAFSKAFSRSVDQPAGVLAKAVAVRAATDIVTEASQVIAFIVDISAAERRIIQNIFFLRPSRPP